MSPGLVCDGFVFFTGFTGTRADGSLSSDPEMQIRDAFAKVQSVLEAGGMGFEHLVEMTSYHVGLGITWTSLSPCVTASWSSPTRLDGDRGRGICP